MTLVLFFPPHIVGIDERWMLVWSGVASSVMMGQPFLGMFLFVVAQAVGAYLTWRDPFFIERWAHVLTREVVYVP